MKKLIIGIIIVLTALFTACSDEQYDSMPRSIQSFITQYWPNTAVESCDYNKTSDSWTIILKNGPTVSFDSAMSWTSVNGNGMPLPSDLLYDRLPPKLYDYLQSGSYTGQVFQISRDNLKYTVELLNSEIYYDIDSAEITGK